MAYSTQADLEKLIPTAELSQLTAESGDMPDAAVTASAISQADAEIDSYLGTRYRVPLDPTPAAVKFLSVDLAIYHLYSRRGAVPQVRRQKYEAGVALLQQVASGQATLEGLAGEPQLREFSGAPRAFGRDELAEW